MFVCIYVQTPLNYNHENDHANETHAFVVGSEHGEEMKRNVSRIVICTQR